MLISGKVLQRGCPYMVWIRLNDWSVFV